MKVFIVMRNDQVDQVFFNKEPAIARAAAETRARDLTAKWAITRVVEQEIFEVGLVFADVSAKLAYEWVRTGHWDLNKFNQWLDAKHIDPNIPLISTDGAKMGRANAQLAYQHIKNKYWPRWQFTQWLNSFL